MKHSKEARQISTDVMVIGGKFFNGVRGGLKQGRVSGTLVFSDKATQVRWHRKGEKEMVRGELTLDLFLKPLLSLMLLASRAMAIATGAIELVGDAARFALVERNAAHFGAAGDDGIDGFEVCFRHGLGVAFEVLRAEGAEDLIEGGHG